MPHFRKAAELSISIYFVIWNSYHCKILLSTLIFMIKLKVWPHRANIVSIKFS